MVGTLDDKEKGRNGDAAIIRWSEIEPQILQLAQSAQRGER
jgi:hypothetical protein